MLKLLNAMINQAEDGVANVRDRLARFRNAKGSPAAKAVKDLGSLIEKLNALATLSYGDWKLEEESKASDIKPPVAEGAD